MKPIAKATHTCIAWIMFKPITAALIAFFFSLIALADEINPLFPALRSAPTALSGASRQKQIPSSKSKFLAASVDLGCGSGKQQAAEDRAGEEREGR